MAYSHIFANTITTNVQQVTKKATLVDTEFLRKNLIRHRGSQKEIADKAGVSREMVRLVLRGKRTSSKVIEVALNVLIQREQHAAEARRRIRHLNEKAYEILQSN